MFVLVALTVIIYSLLFIVQALTTLNVKVKFLKLFCGSYWVFMVVQYIFQVEGTLTFVLVNISPGNKEKGSVSAHLL